MPAVLIRPLPWVLFLPALVVIRYIRVILSLLSICCGFEEIEASTMVTFLHKSRRNVRQISTEAKRNKTVNQCSSITYIKRSILSFLSNLSKFQIPTKSNPNKIQSNKTSVIVYYAGELFILAWLNE